MPMTVAGDPSEAVRSPWAAGITRLGARRARGLPAAGGAAPSDSMILTERLKLGTVRQGENYGVSGFGEPGT